MYFSTIKLKNSVIELKLQKQVALTGLGKKTKQNRTETNSVGKEGVINLQRVRGGYKFIKTLMKLSKN